MADLPAKAGQLFLGCPVWASPQWKGSVFTAKAPRSDWLRQYSEAFNTVEGNSTFYGLPQREAVERWADETSPGFRFALKFPRAISHDARLAGAEAETRAFLGVLQVLAERERLGPSFLQLPPNFGDSEWPTLENYLRKLPRDFPFAVELRHRDYFDGGAWESRLDHLLRELEIDRVLLDSRPLFSAPPADESEAGARRKKPQSPHRTTVTGQRPFVRLIGRNDLGAVAPWLVEWAPIVAEWIRQERTPYFITHAPDDAFAPQLARRFHEEVRRCLPQLPALPPWPGEREVPQVKKQQQLF